MEKMLRQASTSIKQRMLSNLQGLNFSGRLVLLSCSGYVRPSAQRGAFSFDAVPAVRANRSLENFFIHPRGRDAAEVSLKRHEVVQTLAKGGYECIS